MTKIIGLKCVFELTAAMAGGNQPLFGAEIGIVINLTGMGAVGAEFIDLFPEQHLIHLRIIITHICPDFQYIFWKIEELREKVSR